MQLSALRISPRRPFWPRLSKRLPARPQLRQRLRFHPRATAVQPELTQSVVQDFQAYVVPLYGRPDRVFLSGDGSRIRDSEGREYLDFSGGVAVNALGHADSRILEAIQTQSAKLMHTSQLFHTLPSIALCKRLVQNSFADKVFQCNSGTEAIEAGLKFARKWAAVHHGVDPYSTHETGPYEIISFSGGFHGRTMGSLSLTPKASAQAPFLPMLAGSRVATFNDLESVKALIETGKTCAVIVEPVQGEGGVHLATTEFLQGLRSLCDAHECLLIFDEVQCGLGRTGKLWAHQHHNVTPDIMALAKPLAGGLPTGAVLVTQSVSDVMQPGDHGSTFAGNPVISEVANTVFDIINDPPFLQQVQQSEQYLAQKLTEALSGHPRVQEIRHSGLLFGIQCDGSVGDFVTRAMEGGLIVITAGGGDVLRLAPPLNVSISDLDECVEKLKVAFNV